MRNLVLMGAMLFVIVLTAQDKKVKPRFEKEGDVIKATYYHDNGKIAQTGYYKNNKLHGQWKSYDQNGNRIAIAQYLEGKKNGKWFFWNGEILSEVDYDQNKMIAVTRRNNAHSVVVNQ